MKVKNMTGKMGNPVANQFSIHDDYGNHYFQSYDSIIVKSEWQSIPRWKDMGLLKHNSQV